MHLAISKPYQNVVVREQQKYIHQVVVNNFKLIKNLLDLPNAAKLNIQLFIGSNFKNNFDNEFYI